MTWKAKQSEIKRQFHIITKTNKALAQRNFSHSSSAQLSMLSQCCNWRPNNPKLKLPMNNAGTNENWMKKKSGFCHLTMSIYPTIWDAKTHKIVETLAVANPTFDPSTNHHKESAINDNDTFTSKVRWPANFTPPKAIPIIPRIDRNTELQFCFLGEFANATSAIGNANPINKAASPEKVNNVCGPCEYTTISDSV
eukprot:m.56166 g.56166  ORF g.56166 m.56166 type:complete len:196 (+) comp7786_c2_seq1:1131-1718(+)